MVGPLTTFLLGLGVAIGSGILRTPAITAQQLGSPVWMIAAWFAGGMVILAASLVSAELATRFPRAGGEYAFLKEAYGDLIALFFGYGYTIFIVGGGCGIIAAATGEALTELLVIDVSNAPVLGALSVVFVTSINALGLKAGAGLQNGLTGLKIIAILAVATIAFAIGGSNTDWSLPLTPPPNTPLTTALLAAVLPVLWAYEGTTDSIKMAEEMKDVRRDLPRALVLGALALTTMYVVVNIAFLSVLTPGQMATSRFVAGDVMSAVFGPLGRRFMALLSVIIFLGALSASMFATVRVTFALARDGLTFRKLAWMSKAQAPVPALLVVGAIAATFTFYRGFTQIMNIYFLAAAILFGLSYASLIVFRVRDQRSGQGTPAHVFKVPGGVALAIFLIALQSALAINIIIESPKDSIYTLLLLTSSAVVYAGWRAVSARRAR